jgi:hypothetical protein
MLPVDSLPDEIRLRSFLEKESTFSETAISLSAKLGLNSRKAREVLDRYVQMGAVQRRTFERGIEPVYYRYTVLAGCTTPPPGLR